jgi:hypothetical protein
MLTHCYFPYRDEILQLLEDNCDNPAAEWGLLTLHPRRS